MRTDSYSSAFVDFLDRTTGKVSKTVVYPVTRIELIDIDVEKSTIDNIIQTKRTFVVRNGKWVEEQ